MAPIQREGMNSRGDEKKQARLIPDVISLGWPQMKAIDYKERGGFFRSNLYNEKSPSSVKHVQNNRAEKRIKRDENGKDRRSKDWIYKDK